MSKGGLLSAIGLLLVVVLSASTALSGYVMGFRAGHETPKVVVVAGVENIEPQGGAVADFRTFWEAWNLIGEKHLNGASLKPEERVNGAIRGLVASLKDPYSEFFNPEDNKKFREDIQGSFGGVGAEIGMRNNQLVVVAPLKGTPAEQAGLKSGDAILAISGEQTAPLTVQESIQRIRGAVGTIVTLTIFREGWEKERDIPIERAVITIPTLDFEMRDAVLYVQLYSFNGNTNTLFTDAIVEAARAGAEGMILDLRNNPGGFLSVAVDLAGWFLKKGEVVLTEAGRGDEKNTFRADGNEILVDFPTVVIVNNGSASAAEILAGALRDQRGVKLVGEQTFGKGSVQELDDLSDGSSIKLTTAKWVLPSGHVLEGEGLEPDVEVVISEDDSKTERDPQLDKALEVLREEMKKQN